jgi:hypothetical protein
MFFNIIIKETIITIIVIKDINPMINKHFLFLEKQEDEKLFILGFFSLFSILLLLEEESIILLFIF